MRKAATNRKNGATPTHVHERDRRVTVGWFVFVCVRGAMNHLVATVSRNNDQTAGASGLSAWLERNAIRPNHACMFTR